MRRAIPYPWREPRLSSVFRTISASVPCQTSGLLPMRLSLLLVTHKRLPQFLLVSNRRENYFGGVSVALLIRQRVNRVFLGCLKRRVDGSHHGSAYGY